MRTHLLLLNARGHVPRIGAPGFSLAGRRKLVTLAIETSCDDTSVAILEQKETVVPGSPRAVLHFHKKITANCLAYDGVHPLVALESHQENLANLVHEAIRHLPLAAGVQTGPADAAIEPLTQSQAERSWMRRRPDFISVTRGPGMRSNLFTGLDTAKGLALAWQIPLVGVHHMQAHALTPRLVKALQPTDPLGSAMAQRTSQHPAGTKDFEPRFPFLSVLVSGGHTMLLHSATLTDHKMLASTADIAIGNCLDKIACAVLPADMLSTAQNTMYGRLLEEFAFPEVAQEVCQGKNHHPEIEAGTESSQNQYRLEDNAAGEYRATYSNKGVYDYTVPKNVEEQIKRSMTKWGWAIAPPFLRGSGGHKIKSLTLSFSGLQTAVQRIVMYGVDKPSGTERLPSDITLEERRAIAQESMRAVFEHLADRVVRGLEHIARCQSDPTPVSTVVMSGGVAANRFLRQILASFLTARGYADVRIVFPPPSLCTDNAAMIAWTGLEMYQAGLRDSFGIRAIRKWPLDELLSPPEDG